MHRLSLVMLLGVTTLLGFSPRPSLACPLCRDAVPSSTSAEDEDPSRLARAYNRSIYLMVGVPYLLVGAVGYMVYRHLRVRDALTAALAQPQPLPPGDPPLSALPGDRSCIQPTSPGGAS